MTISDPSVHIFSGLYHSSILTKVWSLATHNDKASKRCDSRDVDIPEVVKILLSDGRFFSLGIQGPMLLGLCRIYAKQVDLLHGKLSLTLMNQSSAPVPPSTEKRRRRIVAVESTPLRSIPEDAALVSLDDVLFDNQPILSLPFSRTPMSSRKRVSSTPRDDEIVFFDTPSMGDNVLDGSKRQRRISSISGVLDTLRADDGERRLSGLLGTTFQDADDDEFAPDEGFDTGCFDPPESPPLMLAPPSLFPPSLRRSVVPKMKSLFDTKRAKLEICTKESQLTILNYFKTHKFYLASSSQRATLFRKTDFHTDKTSAVRWYVAPPKRFLKPVDQEVLESHESYESYDSNETHDDVFSDEPEALVDIKTKILSAHTRTDAVLKFMDLLHLANQGVVKLVAKNIVSFSPSSIHDLKVVCSN